MNVFKKLWNGQYPLAKSFWLFYVIGGVASFLLAIAVAGIFLAVGLRPIALVVFGLVYYAYYFLVSVGVWRSANTHRQSQLWPALAKLVIVAWGVRTVWLFVDGGAQNLVAQVMR